MTHPESPPPVVLDRQLAEDAIYHFDGRAIAAMRAIASGTVACIPTADLSTLREKAAAFDALGAQYNALEARYNESSRENDRLRQAAEKVRADIKENLIQARREIQQALEDHTEKHPNDKRGYLVSRVKLNTLQLCISKALRAQEPNNVSG